VTETVDQCRRRLLLGGISHAREYGRDARLHVASAVVTAWPKDREAVARLITDLPGTEISHAEGSRIIVVMEATESGAIGARLLEIALMEGVLSANLVFEQSESLGPSGELP